MKHKMKNMTDMYAGSVQRPQCADFSLVGVINYDG